MMRHVACMPLAPSIFAASLTSPEMDCRAPVHTMNM